MDTPFDSPDSIAAGDVDHLYALRAGVLYHFNNMTAEWEMLTGTTNIQQLAAIPGYLFGLTTTGVPMKWNGDTWVSYYGIVSPAMSQLTVSQGSFSLMGLSNNQIYATSWDGQRFAWIPLSASFTPVRIAASKSIVMALDTANQLWKLSSVTHENYPASFTGNWTQVAQLAAGLDGVVVGGPSDVYAYGAGSAVSRFFPNSSVSSSGPAENWLGGIPNQLPDGTEFRTTTESTVKQYCPGRPVITLTSSIVERFLKNAFTRLHQLVKFGCYYEGLVWVCDYGVETWCTTATTPPSFHPVQVEDYDNATGMWDAKATCIKIPWESWECPTIKVKSFIGVYSNNLALQIGRDAPKAECTVLPN